MRIALFYHSLVSDWNHGNAHFLRGIATELVVLGHDLRIYEPHDSWSRLNLTREFGEQPVDDFQQAYPLISSRQYDLESFNLDRELEDVDLVLVHEWNSHDLVRRIGDHRRRTNGYRLLFHDTHHRSVTDRDSMARYDLSNYDGVLAFGEVIRRIYLDQAWTQHAWTWHEAADTRVFRPHRLPDPELDAIWIGNWGDNERARELDEFFMEPVHHLGLRARVHGVRYPQVAIDALSRAGIVYGGWLPNFRVPDAFSRSRVTLHVPRSPYTRQLPGIPTIRPFEALACGIPLISAPWDDTDGLFRPGIDYLMARDGGEMIAHLRLLLADREFAAKLAACGLERILGRHTCAHRIDELLQIYGEFEPAASRRMVTA